MPVSGRAVALATGGAIVMWSGLSGVSPLSLVKTIAAGKSPPPANIGNLLSEIGSAIFGSFTQSIASLLSFNQGGGATGVVTAAGTGGGAAIANDAEQYVGKVPYVWGGSDPSGWDCSGMVTYVLHHDLGYDLPSNTHTVTGQFYTWSGLTTVSSAEPGDLICWTSHVAIAISATECVGAENPQLGTTTGAFTDMGPGGETYIIRRLNQLMGGSTSATGVVT